MNRYHSPISIPNILTLLRILLTPLFVILLLRGAYSMALLVFIVAGLSDGLDGFIAHPVEFSFIKSFRDYFFFSGPKSFFRVIFHPQ